MGSKIAKYVTITIFFVQVLYIGTDTMCKEGIFKMKQENRTDNDNVPDDKQSIKKRFEALYSQWQDYINQPKVQISSRSQDYINCKPYNDMIKMGEPILPYLIEKMKNGKLSSWKENQFFLWHAVCNISNVNLIKDDDAVVEQNIAERYINWWEAEKQANK